MAPKIEPGSPEWWVERLSTDLDMQAREALRYELYYDGDQPLPIALSTDQYRREFRDMIAAVRDNWMPLVVDAKAQRLTPVGFRFGAEAEADEAANELWQRNYLDADSKLAHSTALTTGRCPVMVWAGEDGQPEITVEHPAHVIVAYSYGGSRRKRDAALKRWVDEWTGDTHYNLYLPDAIHKFSRAAKGRRPLVPRSDVVVNPLGVVPIVELRHRLRHRDGACRSVLKEVTSTQDLLNKTLIDMIVGAEFQAFRQRWATGVEVARDQVTGEPINPFPSKIDRVWTVPAADAKFGEFGQIDLAAYATLREHLVQSLASRTATPPHYLISGQTLPNAESVKAAETGLVASVRDIMSPFGEAWEDVMRLAFMVTGDPRQSAWNAETIWDDPETRSEAEHIDAVLKKRALEVPLFQLWEDAGYSPAQIDRFRDLARLEAEARASGVLPTLDPDEQITDRAGALGVSLS